MDSQIPLSWRCGVTSPGLHAGTDQNDFRCTPCYRARPWANADGMFLDTREKVEIPLKSSAASASYEE